MSGFSSTPKLHYFNGAGAAGTIRLALAVGKVEYTDVRWPVDMSAGFKCPLFMAAKEDGTCAANMGRAPVLEIGDVSIGEKPAIERYIARKTGLMGANDEEAAQIDALGEHINDIKAAYKKAKTDEKVDEYFAEKLPEWMGKFEASLPPAGADGCLVGSAISLADLQVYYFLTFFFTNTEGATASHSKCPRVTAAIEAVAKNPSIVEFHANQPKSDF
jgi:glutathione S-transferase